MPAEYLPTPEEIRAACLEIQATWTRKEEWQRGGHAGRPRWILPRSRLGEDGSRFRGEEE